MTQTLKGIKFRVTLKGHGVVNYDSADQKYFLREHCGRIIDSNDNTTYAKKSFTKLSENEINELREKAIKEGKSVDEIRLPDTRYSLKISSNCLRDAIFRGTSDADSTLWQFPTAACNYITNPKAYMRGYMCAPEKDCTCGIKSVEQFGKKTCLTVTEAIDTSAQLHMEIFSKSGKRDNTSMFYKETAEETNYVFTAIFDVKQAQFMSEDKYFNRQSINPVYAEGSNPLEKAFVRRYGRVPYTKGVYSANSAIFGDSYGEYGMKMDDEFINSLIKELVNSLYDINILRASGEAHTEKVEWIPVYDGVDDAKADWETVDGNNVPTFSIHQFYLPANQQDWEDRAKALNEMTQTKKDKKEREKAEKVARKKAAAE